MRQGDKELVAYAIKQAGLGIFKLRTLRPRKVALKPVLDSIQQTEDSLEAVCQDILKEEKNYDTLSPIYLRSLREEKAHHLQTLQHKVRAFNKIAF